MRQILFSLDPKITKRPDIRDGELWKVFCEFNTDTQVFELMLVK